MWEGMSSMFATSEVWASVAA